MLEQGLVCKTSLTWVQFPPMSPCSRSPIGRVDTFRSCKVWVRIPPRVPPLLSQLAVEADLDSVCWGFESLRGDHFPFEIPFLEKGHHFGLWSVSMQFTHCVCLVEAAYPPWCTTSRLVRNYGRRNYPDSVRMDYAGIKAVVVVCIDYLVCQEPLVSTEHPSCD